MRKFCDLCGEEIIFGICECNREDDPRDDPYREEDDMILREAFPDPEDDPWDYWNELAPWY